MLDTMQQLASDINKMRRSYQFILVDRALTRIAGDQMQKDSTSWLSPPDPSKNYNIGCKTHRDGTATWFFQASVFSEWDANGSLLWIHGKRASSTLVS